MTALTSIGESPKAVLNEHSALRRGDGSFVSARAIIGWVFVACAVLSLVATRGKHFSWVIFGVIAALTFISR